MTEQHETHEVTLAGEVDPTLTLSAQVLGATSDLIHVGMDLYVKHGNRLEFAHADTKLIATLEQGVVALGYVLRQLHEARDVADAMAERERRELMAAIGREPAPILRPVAGNGCPCSACLKIHQPDPHGYPCTIDGETGMDPAASTGK